MIFDSAGGETPFSWTEFKGQIVRNSSWFALFKVLSQAFSWTATVFIARMLQPEDYGLIEMATIITGYAMRFSEMGLGAAIIQRPQLSGRELSSLFWFALACSIFLAASCFGIARLSGWIFSEPRIVPLTKAVSVLFILHGLQIVPLNLLKKRLEFAALGRIEITATVISSAGMFLMASAGFGVWTLMGGWIALALVQTVLYAVRAGWLPQRHLSIGEVREYLRFGFIIVIEGTLFYLNKSSDKFFAGRAWNSGMLGYYSFALQLAQTPTEKITVLINQVAFPALSTLQKKPAEFRAFYLNAVRITAAVVIPLFAGGFLLGDELIRLIFTEKWLPVAKLFQYLCLAQIIISLCTVNGFVHQALGRPQRTLYFQIASACIVPVSFYFAVQYGLQAVLVPWFTSYLAVSLVWIYITIRIIGIGTAEYIKAVRHPLAGAAVMAALVTGMRGAAPGLLIGIGEVPALLFMLLSGAAAYLGYMVLFDRDLFRSLFRALKGQRGGREERIQSEVSHAPGS